MIHTTREHTRYAWRSRLLFGRGALGALVLFLASAAAPCFAQGEYTRFRYEHSKIITRDPFPVQPGLIQIEAEYVFRSSKTQWTDGGKLETRKLRTLQVSVLELSTGIVDRLDVGIALGYAKLIDNEKILGEGDGLTDLLLSATYLFHFDEPKTFAVAYLPSITFPIGSEADVEELGVSPEFYTFDNRIAIVKDWSAYWTTNVDLGYIWFFGENAGVSNGLVTGGAAVGYQYESWLQPVFEFRYARNLIKSGGDEERISVLGGLLMPLSERVRIEFGVQQAVAGRNANKITSIVTNISVTF